MYYEYKYSDMDLTRRNVLTGIGGLAVASIAGCVDNTQQNIPTMLSLSMTPQLYQSPGCSCCGRYVEYFNKRADTQMEINEVSGQKLNGMKSNHHIEDEIASCHTILIEEYVIEGHVPVPAIEKLLEENPEDVVGLSVPGMPANSPGMGGMEAVEVTAIQKDGTTKQFKYSDYVDKYETI